jgi:hypothetical protein
LIITDIYSPLIKAFEQNQRKGLGQVLDSDERLQALKSMISEFWGEDLNNVQKWMQSPEYKAHKNLGLEFIKEAPLVLKKVEESFGTKLKGELRLSPSLMRFDGFARYDSGNHTIWFGVDHPDADRDYLHALLSHELSHVYRDHQPEVWAHLGKPLEKVTRAEYLDAATGQEHLVSEGLATLNSQIVFPEIPIHVHHYYFPFEMQWCLEHFKEIDKAIRQCLKEDQNVWKFYEDDIIMPGSPSRTQYFWAAKILSEWLPMKTGKPLKESVLLAHSWPTTEFDCF